MNQNQPVVKKNNSYIIVAIVFIFIFIGMVIGILFLFKNAIKQSTNQSTKQTELQKNLVYKDIFVFKGNGKKKSEVFHLSGNEAKFVYKYSPGSETEIFTVYVVDKGVDILDKGEIPEIMAANKKEESESIIYKSEGDYYLDVNAVGDWEIIVQEKQ
ncbi:hypothetical protein [uncultured Apibacter sp.]|uniref:hypothetical protein n=1 Tax=uncultured Apibacter sp. TaxID=1778616 RepID=UPI0025E384E8|nr:hypothetical protein [uncultured Apibacter sp.]